jgi:hypothetical protein
MPENQAPNPNELALAKLRERLEADTALPEGVKKALLDDLKRTSRLHPRMSAFGGKAAIDAKGLYFRF